MSDRGLSLAARLRAPESAFTFVATTVLFAMLIRMIVVTLLIHAVAGQRINYNDFGWESWEMGWTARSIFLGHGFSSPFLPITGPTALVPPLYPYLLAGTFHLFGLDTVRAALAVLSFNSLCSALTCIPLYFLARNALNPRIARIVAVAWAIYPFSIYFAADRVWDYALTLLLFTCCLLIAQKLHKSDWPGWAGFGALYGLAALSNPSIVSLLPFLLVLSMWKARRKGRSLLKQGLAQGLKQGLKHGLIAALAFVLVCLPWSIRNERVMHAHFFMRDGFWLEFYAGNNGDMSESNSSLAHPASNPSEMKKYQADGEIAYMAEKHHLAMAFVERHPGLFVESCLRRIGRFWTGYWSLRPQYLKSEPFDLPNIPFCLFLLYFMLRGMVRWWREDRQAAMPYLMAIVIFPIPYYLTHSSMDYRQPIEAVIVILVVIGLFGTRNVVPAQGQVEAAHCEADREAILV